VSKQFGWGLSELLISLFLSSLISTLLIQTYIMSKHQFLVLHDSLEEHFDVQWVQDLLADNIRKAGFTPCLNIDQLEVMNRRAIPINTLSLKMETKPQQSLQVSRMSDQFSELIAVCTPHQILISSEIVLREHHSILIADCQHAEVHEVARVKKIPEGLLLTLTKPVFFTYPSVTYVGRWLEERWYIEKNNKGVVALYYKQTHSEELTPLIHVMKLKQRRLHHKKMVDITLGLNNETTQFSVIVRS
jgi:hypothetical protein